MTLLVSHCILQHKHKPLINNLKMLQTLEARFKGKFRGKIEDVREISS
jgi:hypothetical protein